MIREFLRGPWSIVFGLPLAWPTAGESQAPIVLGPPTVVARDIPAFNNQPLDELRDGRLLVLGVSEVVIVDPRTGAKVQLGREGQGPGEYSSPAAVQVLQDGRLAVLDRSNARLTTWQSDGALDTTVSVPLFAALNFVVDLDAQGRIYWGDIAPEGRQFMGPQDRPGRHPDSTWLYRFTPPRTGFDTVASLVHRPAVTIGSAYRLPLRFGPQDVWGVLPDGGLWVVRVGQHRVDRRSPSGSWRIGVGRPWQPVRTVAAEERRVPDLSTPARGDSIAYPTARVKPPFDYAIADDRGEVWTHLNQALSARFELFAVFPLTGASKATMALPKGRRIVRLSTAYVYALAEDEEGVLILERYDRPGAGPP